MAAIGGLCLPMAAQAGELVITPVQYDFSGGWQERGATALSEPFDQSDDFAFSMVNTLPSSVVAVSAPHGVVRASATLNLLSLDLSGSAGPNQYTASSGDWIQYASIFANAVSRTRVQPQGGSLLFNLSASTSWNYSADEQSLELTLSDLTSGTRLRFWDLTRPEDAYDASGDYNVEVQPSHEYEFAIVGFIEATDFKEAKLSAAITLVPEPCSITLLALGLLPLWAVRGGRGELEQRCSGS